MIQMRAIIPVEIMLGNGSSFFIYCEASSSDPIFLLKTHIYMLASQNSAFSQYIHDLGSPLEFQVLYEENLIHDSFLLGELSEELTSIKLMVFSKSFLTRHEQQKHEAAIHSSFL